MNASTPETVYKVTSVVRNPPALNDHSDISNSNLTVIKGNLNDETQVKSLVSSHDVVVFSVASRL